MHLRRRTAEDDHHANAQAEQADACTYHQDAMGAPTLHGMETAQTQDHQALAEQQQAGHQLAGFLSVD